MYTDKRTTVKQLLLILFPVIIFLNSCTGRQKQQKDVQQPVVENADSSLIFDGKTIEGWEITNFGPQGPVYVSGGEIILGMGEGCTGITWTNDTIKALINA